jgi:hypothetical protein
MKESNYLNKMKSLLTTLLVVGFSALYGSNLKAEGTDCYLYYFGIGQPADHGRALECFESEKNYMFQILMTINGEGESGKKADVMSLFSLWEKDDQWNATSSLQARALRDAYNRKKSEGSIAKLNFCHDVARDTLNVNLCEYIEQLKGNAEGEKNLKAATENLPQEHRAALQKVNSKFKEFKELEEARTYESYISGTIRGLAAMAQAKFVQTNFQKRIVDLSSNKWPVGSSINEFTEAEAFLKKTIAEEREGKEKDYIEALDRAQKSWIEYRSAWLDFIASMKGKETARAVETSLIKERVDEIKNIPIGE